MDINDLKQDEVSLAKALFELTLSEQKKTPIERQLK